MHNVIVTNETARIGNKTGTSCHSVPTHIHKYDRKKLSYRRDSARRRSVRRSSLNVTHFGVSQKPVDSCQGVYETVKGHIVQHYNIHFR